MDIWTKEEEARRLGERFDAGGNNKAEFSRRFKVPGGPSMISQNCSGNRPISLEAAIAYATGFGVSLAAISPRLAQEQIEAAKVMPEGSYKVEKNPSLIPVIGKSMCGLPDRMFTDEGRPTNGHDEYAEVYSSDPGAFVTRVDGNSMYPKYVQGDYALVEPNTAPELEDDVILKTVNGEVMIKRLISKRGGMHLASYNEPHTYTFQPEEIVWMYYVAYPVPAKKIRGRL